MEKEVICIKGGSVHPHIAPPVIYGNRYIVTSVRICACGASSYTVGLIMLPPYDKAENIKCRCGIISKLQAIGEAPYLSERFADIDTLMNESINDEIMEILEPIYI